MWLTWKSVLKNVCMCEFMLIQPIKLSTLCQIKCFVFIWQTFLFSSSVSSMFLDMSLIRNIIYKHWILFNYQKNIEWYFSRKSTKIDERKIDDKNVTNQIARLGHIYFLKQNIMKSQKQNEFLFATLTAVDPLFFSLSQTALFFSRNIGWIHSQIVIWMYH